MNRVPAVLLSLLLCGCALNRHRIDFTALEQADRIEVSTRYSEPVKRITDPVQIRAAVSFVQARQSGWKDPLRGPVVPAYMLAFFAGSRFVGAFGIGQTVITSHPPTHGFWSQDVAQAEMDRLAEQLTLKWPDP
jgi:hypothetical protein